MSKKSKEKVYCRDCKYFMMPNAFSYCDHANNYEDSYYAPKDSMKKDPSDINQNNDCRWYERKIPLWERWFGKGAKKRK